MDRRNFIKKTAYSLCACTLLASTYSLFGCTRKKDPFEITSVDGLPKKVRFDLCSACELNCPVCWRNILTKEEKNAMPQGYLKFDDFKNFIDKHEFLEELFFSSSGEMFLNPDFDRILEYAHQKGLSVQMVNGAHLNNISEKTAENIVKYGVKTLVVSIDGTTPDVYKIYRVGGDFNKVINNIKMINRLKEKYNSEYPVLTWKFVVFGHNEHQTEDAKKKAKSLKMEIVFDANYIPQYSPVKNWEKVTEATGIIPDYITYHYNEYKKDNEYWFYCTDLKNNPLIVMNGELFPCCLLQPHQNLHINVFKEGLMKALNDTKVKEIKKMLTDYSYVSKSAPCCSCDIYKFLKTNNIYLDVK